MSLAGAWSKVSTRRVVYRTVKYTHIRWGKSRYIKRVKIYHPVTCPPVKDSCFYMPESSHEEAAASNKEWLLNTSVECSVATEVNHTPVSNN